MWIICGLIEAVGVVLGVPIFMLGYLLHVVSVCLGTFGIMLADGIDGAKDFWKHDYDQDRDRLPSL